MVLMAIDHVRVYSGLPAGGATFGLFFTRWVTHFCAPVFVFLAGASAFFYSRKRSDLSRFLLIRGLWLVFLELTFFRVAWTFNLDFAGYEMAGVIWVIGWCMVLMSILVKLPFAVIAALGLLIVAGHNLLDAHVRSLIPTLQNDVAGALWKICYVGFFAGPIQFGDGGPRLIVLYSLVPWIGVMASGFAFGRVMAMEPRRRNRICWVVGLSGLALFLLLRGFNIYGDPRPWSTPTPKPGGPPSMPAFFAFLNTSKYPASFTFLLMTLAPAIVMIPVLEAANGAFARWIALFGRVPFFFYLLHIPWIHFLAIVVSKIRLGEVSPWLFANHPMGNPPAPDGYAWELWQLYGVWAFSIPPLYWACRCFDHFKNQRHYRWLTFF